MKKIIFSAALLVLSTFAMAQQNRSKMQKNDPAQMEQRQAENLKMMQTELGLSTAQVVQIKELQEKNQAQRQANSSQMQAQSKNGDDASQKRSARCRNERDTNARAIQ